MKLTAKTYYALIASVDLTRNYGKGPLRAAHIAEKHNIPTRFLELILNELKSAGVIDSKRGAEGGAFFLTDAPETITVYDLVRAIEGEISIIDCGKVSGQADCMFRDYMGGLQTTIINYFQNTTLKELSDTADYEQGALNYII